MKHATGVIYDLQGSLLIRRYCTCAFPASGGLRYRGAISGFSKRSAARMRRYLRTCRAEYRVMVTLTYPAKFPEDGFECKYHLRRFVERFRNAIGRPDDFSCFWFLEFQQRGAPHFHLFTTHGLDKDQVARIWFEIAGRNDLRSLHAGTRIERIRSGRFGTIAYASKYAAKADQKDVPDNFPRVGRFWGVIGKCECLSAAIAFNTSQDAVRQVYDRFTEDLRKEIQGNFKRGKKIPGGNTELIYLHESVTGAVNALFHWYGLVILTVKQETGIIFESPLLEAEFAV